MDAGDFMMVINRAGGFIRAKEVKKKPVTNK